MEKHQYVKEISLGDYVDNPFVVIEKKMVEFTSQKRAGDKFMLLRLQDKTGTIKAVLWENAEEIEPLIKEDRIVWVRGKIQAYKGLQINIEQIQTVKSDSIDLSPFVPVSSVGIDTLKTKTMEQIEGVKNDYLKKLLQLFFNDKKFCHAYFQVPAGKKIHHNYLGGLAEHNLEIIQLLKPLLRLYPQRLDWSILVSGAILHDIGKVFEYDLTSPSFQMTHKGKLLGHITLGQELISSKIKEIENFPESLSLELRHMILSHHGEKEWGSPEIPKTMNALCLFYSDLVSSRLNQVNNLHIQLDEAQRDTGIEEDGWTQYDPLLGRAFFHPDSLREAVELQHDIPFMDDEFER